MISVDYIMNALEQPKVRLPFFLYTLYSKNPPQRVELTIYFFKSVSVKYFTASPGPPTDLTVDEVEKDKIHLSLKRPNYFIVTGYQVEINQEFGWKFFARVRIQMQHKQNGTDLLQVVNFTSLLSLLHLVNKFFWYKICHRFVLDKGKL